MNKFAKRSLVFLAIMVIFYVTKNAFFGWNTHPESRYESVADVIVAVLAVLAIRDQTIATVLETLKSEKETA